MHVSRGSHAKHQRGLRAISNCTSAIIKPLSITRGSAPQDQVFDTRSSHHKRTGIMNEGSFHGKRRHERDARRDASRCSSIRLPTTLKPRGALRAARPASTTWPSAFTQMGSCCSDVGSSCRTFSTCTSSLMARIMPAITGV